MKIGTFLRARRRSFSAFGSQAKAESRKWKAETKPMHRAIQPISAFRFLFSTLSMNLPWTAVTILVFELGVTALHGQFAQTNSALISIPETGTATLYPSTINVSGMAGVVTNVTVKLNSISDQ